MNIRIDAERDSTGNNKSFEILSEWACSKYLLTLTISRFTLTLSNAYLAFFYLKSPVCFRSDRSAKSIIVQNYSKLISLEEKVQSPVS